MTAPVRIVSGFTSLVRAVQAYFEDIGSDATVACGYRQRAQQINHGGGGANRVIFLPGDPGGAAGKISAPRDVGRTEVFDADDVHVATIRPLASWDRQFTLSIWGWDKDSPRDELAQIAATEDLFELTLRALEQVKGAGGPNVAWGRVAWRVPKENTLGSELLVGLALTHPLMDAPDEVFFPSATLQRVGT